MSRNPKTHHNAHMWLPKDLYHRVREQALLEGCTVTHLVVEALNLLMSKKETER